MVAVVPHGGKCALLRLKRVNIYKGKRYQLVVRLGEHHDFLIQRRYCQIGDRQVLYAEHTSGTVHRMVSTKPFQEADWSAFGFASISNLESQSLDQTARGSQNPQGLVTAHIRSMVNDDVLDRLSLTRDSSGQIQRRLLFATLGGLPDADS